VIGQEVAPKLYANRSSYFIGANPSLEERGGLQDQKLSEQLSVP
jgi:hypothetical protein